MKKGCFSDFKYCDHPLQNIAELVNTSTTAMHVIIQAKITTSFRLVFAWSNEFRIQRELTSNSG